MRRFRHRPALAWLIAFAITLQGLAAHAMVLPAGDAETSLESALRIICTGHGVARLPDGGQEQNVYPDHDCSLCQCSPAVAKARTLTASTQTFAWVRQSPARPGPEHPDKQSTRRTAAPRAPPQSIL